MEKEKVRLTATLKGAALVEMVEAGLIQEKEDGNIDTCQFEQFWKNFSTHIGESYKCNDVKAHSESIGHLYFIYDSAVITSVIALVASIASLLFAIFT